MVRATPEPPASDEGRSPPYFDSSQGMHRRDYWSHCDHLTRNSRLMPPCRRLSRSATRLLALSFDCAHAMTRTVVTNSSLIQSPTAIFYYHGLPDGGVLSTRATWTSLAIAAITSRRLALLPRAPCSLTSGQRSQPSRGMSLLGRGRNASRFNLYKRELNWTSRLPRQN